MGFALRRIQFADYMYPPYDQIVSEAARLRYRSMARLPVRSW
jgi:pyruvate/2-oxoglutarate/acetoin dehydrogenase E1 component